jgi:hypothetical protein
MKISLLAPPCPQCGAHKIAYSCEPKCCFNHVCGDCHYSFLLHSQELGQQLPPDQLPDNLPEIDICAPTTECAKCQSLKVYQIEFADLPQAQAICADCRALLKLEFIEEE